MTDTAPPKARIETLDVLRGLAVLGILAVNAQSFAMPWPWFVRTDLHPPVTAADAAAHFAVQVFFQGKFISLFSMLFGVSVFLVGGERDDRVGGSRLRRRLFWLGVIGVSHGAAVWYGDILLVYALTGFAVMLARSWRPGTLIVTGASILLAVGALALLGTVSAVLLTGDAGAAVGSFRQAEAAALAAEGGYRGGFSDSLRANFRDWKVLWTLTNLPSVVFIGPLMLLGLGLFKAGVFTGEAPPRVYAGLLAAGAAFLMLMAALTIWEARSGYRGPAADLAGTVNGFFAPLATLAYVSLIAPRAARGGLRRLSDVLAPVGRMAFTNYLSQSLIMTALFYGGRGPGLFGEVERAGLLAVVAAVWVLQILWSRWWLKRFAYGPMEWLWRSLTEGRAVPIRRLQPA